MQSFNWISSSLEARKSALSRPTGLSDDSLTPRISAILDAVKSGGDQALRDLTEKFDGAHVSALRVENDTLKNAWTSLPTDQQAALKTAKANIALFHGAQKPEDILIETMPGVTCQRVTRAIQNVGLYVPGGTAPLVSTLLMLAIPAKIAGCTRRVVMTPPDKSGNINPAVLASAYLCDVTDVFIGGGAQAIAALAYGTESIPKCDKIFGPGNAYVALAKSLVSSAPGGPAIDLPAGPSEAMVIADESANPDFVAADLLSQAEHDTLAQVICVCTNKSVADAVAAAVESQIQSLPRKDIALKAMSASRMIVAGEPTDILDIINQYGPEHLIIQTDNPETFLPKIDNAGSVFLGHWTPESVGDYASGTNHTLPTFGAAKAYSGVMLESFLTFMSIQKLTRDGLTNLGPTVECLAEMEGLEAHRRAVSLRRKALS